MKLRVAATLTFVVSLCLPGPEAWSQERGFYLSAETGYRSVSGLTDAIAADSAINSAPGRQLSRIGAPMYPHSEPI